MNSLAGRKGNKKITGTHNNTNTAEKNLGFTKQVEGDCEYTDIITTAIHISPKIEAVSLPGFMPPTATCQ